MRPLLPLLLTLALAGCSTESRTVEEVMRLREQALATADASLYASLISPLYQDKGLDFREKRTELAKTLSDFGPVSYRSLSRTVTVNRGDATVTGKYAMKVTVKGKPLEITGEETIRLRRETDGWKIVGGI